MHGRLLRPVLLGRPRLLLSLLGVRIRLVIAAELISRPRLLIRRPRLLGLVRLLTLVLRGPGLLLVVPCGLLLAGPRLLALLGVGLVVGAELVGRPGLLVCGPRLLLRGVVGRRLLVRLRMDRSEWQPLTTRIAHP